jgi:hypothetical protein
MGCFETKTYEDFDGEGGHHQRRNDNIQNFPEENQNLEEEEFEDFKEIGSKYNKQIINI